MAAGVVFHKWDDEQSAREIVVPISRVEPYQPGQFYRRELPCLLEVLRALDHKPDVTVIDGYVWLGNAGQPGLGAQLFEALGGQTAVVGVAKTQFHGATTAVPITRGNSRMPLYVTAAGIETAEAARHIQTMHGAYRMPTLLRRVDQLCRQG
jgi:deoxyribonuclease V